VAPAELESILMGMPGIRDAAVIGLPDAACGELPLAFVVLLPNAKLTEANIIDYVKGNDPF
jgi:4-coumarate--CoA ligase